MTLISSSLTSIVIDNEELFATTDDDGVAEFSYTGKGAGTVNVTTPLDNTASVTFYDNPDYVSATVTGGSGGGAWITGKVIVDWGDGTTNTVNNPSTALSHTYTDGVSSHNIRFIGNVTKLGKNCFRNVTGLTSVSIINTVTSLGENCFYGCTGLTSINLPVSITKLDTSCFESCTGLTSVTLPDNITTVGNRCFRYCSNLETIVFPDSVNSIGEY